MILLSLFQSCSIQKMRYSRGFNISFERYAKDHSSDKRPAVIHQRKNQRINAVSKDCPVVMKSQPEDVAPIAGSIPDTMIVHAPLNDNSTVSVNSALASARNSRKAKPSSGKWNDFVPVSLVFVLMSAGTLPIISSTLIYSFYYVTFALAVLAILFAVIGLLGIRNGKGTGTAVASVVIILAILLIFFSGFYVPLI